MSARCGSTCIMSCASWTMSRHTPDIPSTLLINVGALRLRVCNSVRSCASWISGYQKARGNDGYSEVTQRSTRHEPNSQNPRTQPTASGPKTAGMGTPRHPPPLPASPSAGENRVRFPRQHVTHSTRVRVLAFELTQPSSSADALPSHNA